MCKEQEVMIGICGGVGPAAGLLLHQHILQHTESNGEDQGHLNVCHFSRSEDMTDRTEFLLSTTERRASVTTAATGTASATVASVAEIENPARGMARTFAMMRAAATTHGKVRLITGVPCNTFHARAIWDEFLRLTKAGHGENVSYVHMLDETVKFIRHHVPSCRRIGILATTGTRQSRVYHDLLEPLGYELVEVPMTLQNELHESIYNKSWGIKSTAPNVAPRCVANFHRYARLLRDHGAEVIVLGCTEIPFAFTGKHTFAGVPLIDPLVALARALIREADPTRLKQLAQVPPRPVSDNRLAKLVPPPPSTPPSCPVRLPHKLRCWSTE